MKPEFLKYFTPGSLTFFNRETILNSSGEFPLMLNVEPTNDCNLNCVMCSRNLASRPVNYLPFSIFERLMNQAAEHGGVKWLALHKDGESLLHPQFGQMAKLAKSSGGAEFVHFNTNVTLLDEKAAQAIIEAQVDSLTLSIDANSPEVFQQVKRGGDFETVVRQAEGLMDLKTRSGSDKPWVRAKIIDMPATSGQIDAFKRRWIGLTDEVQVQGLHSYARTPQEISPAERYPCSLLWYSLAINSDSTVSTCCVDYRCQDILGSLEGQSLDQIYKGPKLAHYRESMLAGRYHELVSCAHCDCWRAGEDLRINQGPGWNATPKPADLGAMA